ncbi:hypothetical protein [Modestobacter sp. Leaf380]|uniref:hypothetical protein n=1 Tax=Modestobacter sp. Leaf380 TaxID=1736356 RepID=UPI00070148EE|nr:hypothetical protein [Modestobacter sp. Leaf380]KQS69275.1 hypothetical protein ASG41_21935 [Modestobacter sp. Leaf380]
MTAADPKADFYFRHRAAIEEWAALRSTARAAFNDGLSSALSVFDPDEVLGASEVVEQRGSWHNVGLRRPEWPANGWPVAVVLGWNAGTVLDPARNELPFVGVYLEPGDDRKEMSKDAALALATVARNQGWTGQREDAYPLWTQVPQPEGDPSMASWVQASYEALHQAWTALSPAISHFVSTSTPSTAQDG